MALNQTMIVDVTNISTSEVIYNLPELSVRRTFQPGEVKKISIKELRALDYSPGGAVLIRDYLSVDSAEFLEELGIDVQPEYFWDEEKVKELLANGSLEELQDALDFAPEGIKEMIQDLAVSTKLNDMSKREAILEATGFNVTQAINLLKEDEPAEESEKPAGRRVQPAAEEKKERRTTPQTYKVVSK